MKVQKYLFISLVAVVLINVRWGAYPIQLDVKSFDSQKPLENNTLQSESSEPDISRLFYAHLLNHLRINRIFVPPEELEIVVSTVRAASERYDLKPELIFSLIEKESTFKSNAVSTKGAIGLMQILPSTAEILASELNIEWSGEHILFDPAVNIEMGTYYLHKLLKRFNDIDTALSAYNVGPTRIEEMKGDAPSLKTNFSLHVRNYQSRLLP